MGSLGIVPNLGQIYNPDSFTGDGSEVDFTLTHLVTSDQSIIWVEGGVVQKPGIDFTVSGLTLTRTTAPANLVACFAMYLGVSMDIGVPSDGTVTLAKMAVNSVDSDQYVDGSIDAVHMSANSIDSDSYVDGSIDEAHIANDAIDFAAHLKAGTDGELITWDSSGNPAAVPVGTDTHVLTSGGIGVAPTFQAAAAGGDTRNFIIDGDFTQWPEGTAAGTFDVYGPGTPALIRAWWATSGMVTSEQSTNTPTIAESGHNSSYSMLVKCTTALPSSLGANQGLNFRYTITGTDFAYLHQQQITISFWCKTASANTGDTYCIAFRNSAYNRSYVTDFTATSSWTKITKTITLDTSGTWLFTEADIGMRVEIGLAMGTDYHGTADSWEGANDMGTSSTSNFMDNTSNEFYFSQFQIVLGSSSPTFLGESVATVLNQVDYYVQRYNYEDASNEAVIGTGNCNGVNSMPTIFNYRNKMRVAPTATKSAVATWLGKDQAATVVLNVWTANSIGKNAFHAVAGQAGTNWATGSGGHILRNGTATAFVMIDARH